MTRLSPVVRAGLVTLLLALTPISGVAHAREITAGERASLAQTVADFATAMKAKDLEGIVSNSISPRLLETIAKDEQAPVDALRSSIIASMKASMAGDAILSFGMDLSQAKYREAPNGAPYALIPTETVVDVGAGKIQQTSETLALIEGGKWYLLRITQPAQVQLLVRAYPEFANVTFGTGTTKAAP